MSGEHAAIWFGILVVKMAELCLITPPIGLNCFVVAGVRPELNFQDVFRGASPYFAADVVTIAVLIMSLGIHPLVIVLVAVNVMPAAALGVSTLTYAVLILGLWTSSTIGSPMSANNLMFSRQLGVPVWRLAWVWNMPAALLNFTTTVVLGLVLQQIARLG